MKRKRVGEDRGGVTLLLHGFALEFAIDLGLNHELGVREYVFPLLPPFLLRERRGGGNEREWADGGFRLRALMKPSGLV